MSALIAVVLFYEPNTNLMDISLLFTVLSWDTHAFLHIRHLSVMTLLVIIALALQLVSLSLWLRQGSANANFVFFEGCVMSFALAILIVEFVGSKKPAAASSSHPRSS